MGSTYTAHIYVMDASGAYPSGHIVKAMEGTPGQTLNVTNEVTKMGVLVENGLVLDSEKTTTTEFTVANNNSTIVEVYI